MSLTTTPPSGSAIVPQPTPRGSQYGPVHCGRSVGGGIIGASFTVPETGNTVGKYTEYFKTGSIRGTYKLAPTEAGPISVTTFDSQDWLGTITITGGTGAYSAIKPSRHGVVKCSSPDSVHLSCTEKISESSL